MASETVYFIVDLAINAGEFDQFDGIARKMIAGSQTEPGTLRYDWYLSADRMRCRLVEVYADGNAALAHMRGPVVQELVPKLRETASITRFEVYGEPGPKAADTLTKAGAEIFGTWRGLSK